MRNSFVFYRSFAEAANLLGDKARLKLYDAIVELALSCVENVSDLEQVCSEIESKLVQNRNAFAQFLLIKPQIFSNFERFINGSKGAEYGALGASFGKLGGRPAKNTKNPPNVNVNVNDNVNDLKKETSKEVSKESFNYENKKYFFEGKIIKINKKDFDDWIKAYPHLNLYAELKMYDAWLYENDPEVKAWYMRTSKYLLNQDEARKKQKISAEKAETSEQEFYL
jgi:hypothetical protein